MENNNEDFNTRLKFDEWQHLSEKQLSYSNAWDTHAFYFNAGIIIVMLYGFDKIIEHNLSWYFKLLPLIPVLLCGISIGFLLRTFHHFTQITSKQQDYIFNKTEGLGNQIARHDYIAKLYNKMSHILFIFGSVFAFVSLCVGVFLDFDKKDGIHKLEIINCSMTEKITNTTYMNGFPPGKSFSQQTVEAKANPPSASFSQQTVATQQQTNPVTQETTSQNTSTATTENKPK